MRPMPAFFFTFGFFVLCSEALAEDYYLCHVANGDFGGGSFRMTFVLFNTNNAAVTARLRLTSDSGGPLTLTIPGLGVGSDFNIPLAAGGTVIYKTDGSGSLVAGAAVSAALRASVSRQSSASTTPAADSRRRPASAARRR